MFRKSTMPDPEAITLFLEADTELGYTLGTAAYPERINAELSQRGEAYMGTLPRRWLLREAIAFVKGKAAEFGCDVAVVDPENLWDDTEVHLYS